MTNIICKIASNKWYILFIFIIIQPLNGFNIAQGSVYFGVFCIILQIPWLLYTILPRLNN